MNKSTEKPTTALSIMIKEKIGQGMLTVSSKDHDRVLMYDEKRIAAFSAEAILFDDGSSLSWDATNNLHDLVKILIWVDDWVKAREENWISIRWSIYDFEDLAQQKEENENLEVGAIYDRSKFTEALHLLEKKHDCNFGITWQHLDHYLDEYCKLQN